MEYIPNTLPDKIANAISLISGSDRQDNVRKIENIMFNLVDSVSFGLISSVLDEYFPEADSETKSILREAYNKASQAVNAGEKELADLSSYEGMTRVGSATDQYVTARKADLKKKVDEGYKTMEEVSEKLGTPMSVAERIRDIK